MPSDQSPYAGPAALGHSKYASPARRNAALAAFPSADASFTNATLTPTTDNIIATGNSSVALKSANKVPQNADVELAVAQGNTLKDDIDRYAARFSRTVCVAMINTRQLLELIRNSMQKDNATDLKTVEDLWLQLEQLFAAANEAKAALPAFLEKQRNSMSLYHASMMNDTIRETQEELNIQHKKVNIQHNLILEHQEAFLEYKTQTAAKLKEVEDFQERVSRLTLEKGNFRTEVDKYKHLLEKEMTTRAEDLQKADALQKELETLAASKQQLVTETETLRNALSDFQEKMKTTEQQITGRLTAEIQATADQLAKETQKTTSLSAAINTMKNGNSTARMEADKVKLENKALTEKYKEQSAEHAQAFTKLTELAKKNDTLNTDIGRFQKENHELNQQLAKLPELEKQNAELVAVKSNLLEQAQRLTTELSTAKIDSNRATTELNALHGKVKKLNQEVEDLEMENNDLLSKQGENKRAVQALAILKAENSKLETTIDELQAGRAAFPVSGPPISDQEKKALEEQISRLEARKTSLESALQEWTDLAKRSYKEYQEMLPTYKQAEQYRKDALHKEDVIKGLKLELIAAKTSQSNGVGANGDANYWKDKYESLLSTICG
ncbi:uncharacterized protein K460DRAFT_305703 [Cucurbitaria berberidis CBS 394.84]|uniref:Uncharacterized protein n=1 Tax=Cucurbitaria berberidis CBS 394.84 TaxID=1168544 RepID=A0A9P4GQL7_9PLEO|nr:uncharacterized protein K460DRAFT_305703 [Cucurbitaria berberidis CBS 394.84]KAF1849490.1 hypothetical protein K460DRAFT_305703 [Cucurbitaria berberidis CBS 394.84]